MTHTVHLTLTIEQAQAVSRALDLYSSLCTGQFDDLVHMASTGKIKQYRNPETRVDEDTLYQVNELIRQLADTLGYPQRANLGIGHRIHITGRRTWEVKKVLDNALSMHSNPNPTFRTVNYDGLTVRYTDDPTPAAEVKEQA